MINLILRLVIGFILAALLMGAALHFLGVPPDRYLPPVMNYDRATAKTVGVVTKTEDLGYLDHWWAGSQKEFYVDYSFQPITHSQQHNGTIKTVIGPGFYTGSVRITDADYDAWNKALEDGGKQPIEVTYDPLNPSINGVSKSLGGFSRSSGFLGAWLAYLVGLVAVALIFEETLKRWMPST